MSLAQSRRQKSPAENETDSSPTNVPADSPINSPINVEDFRGLVEVEARRIYFRIHRRVDLEDLVSIGMIGLMVAVERFDPTRGKAFATFARFHIRGRILDGLGEVSPLPRRAWRRIQRKTQQPIFHCSFESAEPRLSTDRDGLERLSYALDGSRLPSALATLPVRSRHLLALIYYDGLNASQAASKLGISKAQASRDRKTALRRLRRHFMLPAESCKAA